MLHSASSTYVSGRRAFLALLIGVATSALAHQAASAQSRLQGATGDEDPIIVIGSPEALRGITPERSYSAEDAASYGASTVEDLLAALNGELGDAGDEPVVLVNGERVESIEDIAGYPVEAIRRLDVLPRGTSSRVGGPAGRRVFSLQLRREVRSATVTGAYRVATEGDWAARRGDIILTHIQGPNRANLTLRARDENDLLESERDIVQLLPRPPYDLRGNIIADPRLAGTEIDPALSLLAGRIVTVAGVPSGANPTLADFAARAELANLTDLGDFRTLRPRTRNHDVNLTVNRRLSQWLTAAFNARLNHTESRSLSGLPRGLFVLPSTNPFSPFTRDVGLPAYGAADPLDSRFRSIRGDVSLALNASFGRWRGTLSFAHQTYEGLYRTERQDFSQLSGSLALPAGRNPFAAGFADLLPTAIDRSLSRTGNNTVQATVNGPLTSLPAGPLLATLEARLARFELDSRSEFLGALTTRELERSERALRGAIDIPIASRRAGFLPELGELSATVEYALIDYSDAGSLGIYTYGMSWAPIDAILLQGTVNHLRRPAAIQSLGDPVVVTPAVRTFDYLTGDTVDATWIAGGNPNLLPERIQTRRLALALRPLAGINAQINGEYIGIRHRNYISGLPPASAAIQLAFPDRFVRDPNGRLTVVDIRPVSFDRYSEDRLRYGLSLNLPVGPSRAVAPPAGEGATPPSDDGQEGAPSMPRGVGGPRASLLVSANHTIVLENEIVVRPTLPTIDLLDGGAIGIAGGRNRHLVDFNIAVNDRGLGFGVNGNWRSATEIETRISGVPGRLRFGSLGTVNLRAFAEAQRLFPQASWLRGTRFTLSVFNLANERQRVTDSFGNTPLQYQPGYRDPVGRSIEIEIRKVF